MSPFRSREFCDLMAEVYETRSGVREHRKPRPGECGAAGWFGSVCDRPAGHEDDATVEIPHWHSDGGHFNWTGSHGE